MVPRFEDFRDVLEFGQRVVCADVLAPKNFSVKKKNEKLARLRVNSLYDILFCFGLFDSGKWQSACRRRNRIAIVVAGRKKAAKFLRPRSQSTLFDILETGWIASFANTFLSVFQSTHLLPTRLR